MNKKILIASIFATLMLLVPTTSVVGVSDVSLNRKIEKIEDNNTITETYDIEDCGCKEIDNKQLGLLEKKLNKLEVYSKLLLVLSKYNTELLDDYEELSDMIPIIKEIDMSSPFCDWLAYKYLEIYNEGLRCLDRGLLFNGLFYLSIALILREIYEDLCEENEF
jgi:hypothetical protein